jgi:DNA-binding transcriptional ArsR family regulator
MLRQSDQTASNIARTLKCTNANLSQHLRVLRHAGVIRFRRRGTKLVYRLNRSALEPGAHYFRAIMEPARHWELQNS